MKGLLSGIFCLVLVAPAWSQYKAQIFEMGSEHKTKLFSFEQKVQKDGSLLTEWIDANGSKALSEKVTLKGIELVKSDLDHLQTNQKASIEVKDGKVIFTKTTEGKTKTEQEDLGKTLIVPANLSRFIKVNWSELASGKTIEFRLASWERMETVGFQVKKISEDPDKKTVQIEMKAASFIIAALVKPIYFKFSQDGSQMLESKGRVAPKKQEGSSWKDLDAETMFTY